MMQVSSPQMRSSEDHGEGRVDKRKRFISRLVVCLADGFTDGFNFFGGSPFQWMTARAVSVSVKGALLRQACVSQVSRVSRARRHTGVAGTAAFVCDGGEWERVRREAGICE